MLRSISCSPQSGVNRPISSCNPISLQIKHCPLRNSSKAGGILLKKNNSSKGKFPTAAYSPEQNSYRQYSPASRQQQQTRFSKQRQSQQNQQPGLRQSFEDQDTQYWPDQRSGQSSYLPRSPDRPPQVDPRTRTYGGNRPTQQQVLNRRQRARPRFSPPAEDEVILSNNQILNKQVITRVTGNLLGNISTFYVDPDTLKVVSAGLRPNGFSLGNSGSGNLLLETLCQIGDVVLVHDESVLDLVPQDESVGFLDLIGCPIYTSQGDSLGKVRSFSFSPDSGSIDCLRYDSLGWPAIPEALVGVWEVGVECVQEIDGLARITLLPGAESGLNRVSDGPLELAFVALQKLFASMGSEEEYESDRELDREFEKWKLQYAPYFLQHYGQPPPATRQELDRFYQDLSAPREPVAVPVRPTRAAPAYLPPGRQERMADVLQNAPVRETVARRPQQRSDPRMRTQNIPQNGNYMPQYPEASSRGSGVDGRGPQYREAGPSTRMFDSSGSPQAQQIGRDRDQADQGTFASIPLYDPRPSAPPNERRDADGGYGEAQGFGRADKRQQAFDDWVQAAEQPAMASQYSNQPFAQSSDKPYTNNTSPSYPRQSPSAGQTSSDGFPQSNPAASPSNPQPRYSVPVDGQSVEDRPQALRDTYGSEMSIRENGDSVTAQRVLESGTNLSGRLPQNQQSEATQKEKGENARTNNGQGSPQATKELVQPKQGSSSVAAE